MTRYDEPPASDGFGGPHPLAGVGQEALDASVQALLDVGVHDGSILVDLEELEAVAHSVLAAGLAAQARSMREGSEPSS